jgi:hypothetical protein
MTSQATLDDRLRAAAGKVPGVVGGQKSDQALQIDFCPPTP